MAVQSFLAVAGERGPAVLAGPIVLAATGIAIELSPEIRWTWFLPGVGVLIVLRTQAMIGSKVQSRSPTKTPRSLRNRLRSQRRLEHEDGQVVPH